MFRLLALRVSGILLKVKISQFDEIDNDGTAEEMP